MAVRGICKVHDTEERNSDCRSMNDMLNYRMFLVLMGTVVWSRYGVDDCCYRL